MGRTGCPPTPVARSTFIAAEREQPCCLCVVQEVGQQMSYTYDIGDNWRHVITVVEVLPEVGVLRCSSSTSRQ